MWIAIFRELPQTGVEPLSRRTVNLLSASRCEQVFVFLINGILEALQATFRNKISSTINHDVDGAFLDESFHYQQLLSSIGTLKIVPSSIRGASGGAAAASSSRDGESSFFESGSISTAERGMLETLGKRSVSFMKWEAEHVDYDRITSFQNTESSPPTSATAEWSSH